MSAKHLLRAAFAGAVLLGAYLNVPWLSPAIEDPDQIRAF